MLVLRGYVWIASADQVTLLDTQTQALLTVGVAPAEIYEDVDCPRRQERPALQTCLSRLDTGDILVVWQLERLVDSRAHLVDLLQELRQRDIGLRILNGQGAPLSTTQISLKQILDVLAAMNDLESQISRELSMAGVAAARAKGQMMGPKPKVTAALLRQAMTAISTSDKTIGAIASDLGITRATLYNYLNGDGSPKPAGQALLAKGEPLEDNDND